MVRNNDHTNEKTDSSHSRITHTLSFQHELGKASYICLAAKALKGRTFLLQGTSFLLAQGEEVWVLGEKYDIPYEAEDKELYDQVLIILKSSLQSNSCHLEL